MEALRRKRREEEGLAPWGRTSDQDQDLLRAMLVFACAGVDATVKTLIRDALPTLADLHPEAKAGVKKFAERYVSDAGAVSPKALASILTSDSSPRDAVLEAYVEDLTGGSLQSPDELHRVCEALRVTDQELRNRVEGLRPAFRARNEIIHELDLNPDVGRRRRDRTISSMVEWASEALAVAQSIANEVSASLESRA